MQCISQTKSRKHFPATTQDQADGRIQVFQSQQEASRCSLAANSTHCSWKQLSCFEPRASDRHGYFCDKNSCRSTESRLNHTGVMHIFLDSVTCTFWLLSRRSIGKKLTINLLQNHREHTQYLPQDHVFFLSFL